MCSFEIPVRIINVENSFLFQIYTSYRGYLPEISPVLFHIFYFKEWEFQLKYDHKSLLKNHL